MPTTYAAYSNLIAANGHNPAMASAASSTPTSQRNSVSSEASIKKSRWHRFLDELKPLDEPVANPVGFFSPIPPYPPRQKKTSSAKAEDSQSRRASKAFEHFRSVAMERHSPRARA